MFEASSTNHIDAEETTIKHKIKHQIISKSFIKFFCGANSLYYHPIHLADYCHLRLLF